LSELRYSFHGTRVQVKVDQPPHFKGIVDKDSDNELAIMNLYYPANLLDAINEMLY